MFELKCQLGGNLQQHTVMRWSGGHLFQRHWWVPLCVEVFGLSQPKPLLMTHLTEATYSLLQYV